MHVNIEIQHNKGTNICACCSNIKNRNFIKFLYELSNEEKFQLLEHKIIGA